VHRTEGGLNNEGAVEQQIAHAERIRRELVAATIETCRNGIIDAYYISEDILGSLLFNSPFIPNDLLQTFSRGFCRFFQGDFTSAIYILTPLLENSLRHVLKGHGHEVTKFDDADLTQEDRTISSLFLEMRAELESIFTNPVVADIEHVFLKRPGPALRHQLAHGLLHDNSVFAADALYGCWLMFRLCCLPLLPYVADIELLGER
jgi:hypothetical protein